MKHIFTLTAALALLSLCGIAQANIDIETVPIGGLRNAADVTGYGNVDYAYNIGKYEVTYSQYVAFLNGVAGMSDPYGLYNQYSGITNTGSGATKYAIADAYKNFPIIRVSWYDALRFANWLTNGQGSSSTETGSYTITGGKYGTVTIPTAAQRKTLSEGTTTKWFLASENEWYKAAYYKNGAYSLYANGTSTAPIVGPTGSNYNNPPGVTRWDGSINGALEQNGTKDMMGNVWEWNEAVSGSDRGLRGGGIYHSSYYLQTLGRNLNDRTFEDNSVGFRVSAVVPEPSSIIALLGGLTGLIGLRRRKG